MTPKHKKFLFISGSIFILFVSAIIALVLLVDVNAYKPFVEKIVSDATRMDFKIKGKMGIVLPPRFGISMGDVVLKKNGVYLASADRFKMGLMFFHLLNRKVRITEFDISEPVFFIERDKKGKFNFEEAVQRGKGLPLQLRSLEKIIIKKGDLSYLDKKSNSKTEFKDFDLTATDFSFMDGGRGILRDISFTGDFKCAAIRKKGFTFKNLGVAVKGRDRIFDLDLITMNFFGGKEKGRIKIDMKGDIPFYSMRYSATGFPVEKLLESFSRKRIMAGEMDFSLDIAARGNNFDEMKRTMNGRVSLKGENTLLNTFDLDSLISKIEKSQSFTLVDVGAFFLVGPIGTALTKGYDFAGVYKELSGGRGSIEKLVSEWDVKNGIAETKDVALATKKNRVALKGRLNFVSERFDDVTVAVIDEKGCPKFSQKIHGPFNDPQTEKLKTFSSIVEPVFKIFKDTIKFIGGGKCEIFYNGSVKHPQSILIK